MTRFTRKPAKNNLSAKLAKELSKLSPERDLVRAWTLDWPILGRHPWLLDQERSNIMRLEEIRKKEKKIDLYLV